jgi:hypothetical protein
MARRKVSARKNWQESWKVLAALGVALPKGDECSPVWCESPVAGQKKFRGLTVRKRVFEEVDLARLCLNKTLFVGCRFHGVSLAETDLIHCCLHGCQFVDCDFSGVRLIRADLGECGFFAGRFVGAVLIGADLSEATLEHCDFTDADLTGACVDLALKPTLPVSDLQRDRMIDWRDEADEGPDES